MAAPRFSIITPVHDPPLGLLRACLASIEGQTFRHWELCLVDDGSKSAEVRAELRRLAANDLRVKLEERPVAGGIVAASNDALAMATGEFVVLVDHDDLLEAHALELIDTALRRDGEIDYVYTDEDKLDADGTVRDTFYKPDWSPERLRAQNYCTHLSVLRRRIVAEVGRFREGFDGSQDHDLILRVSERARRVHHVPEVLYHWCVTPGSAAGDSADAPSAKPYAQEAGRRAVAAQLDRLGIPATVEHLATRGHYRSRRVRPEPAPPLSVIVATRGTARPVWGVERPLVLGAVRSLLAVTDYPRLEVLVVVDGATPPPVVNALQALDDVRVVVAEGPWNRPARWNEGVRASDGEYVVLLDDDTLVEQPDWLDAMLGFFGEPDVGAAGARLLAADGTLHHGGILLNSEPLPIFEGFAGDDPGAFGLLEIDREVSAVSGACLVTRRDLYDELGGFAEEFADRYADVDYCLRVRRTGRRIVWTPHATLYHFAPETRPAERSDLARLRERWGDDLDHDPYGSPNFAPGQAVWLPAERANLVAALHATWRRWRFVGRT
jgi:GT2 family glycosyltransferase